MPETGVICSRKAWSPMSRGWTRGWGVICAGNGVTCSRKGSSPEESRV